MARINHYSNIDVIKNLFTDAKEREIMHISIDDGNASGRTISIGKREIKNFGTCGYLGLELHEKLIEGSIEFTRKFGVQYSLSRTYGTPEINIELEKLVEQIYGYPCIVYPSTSLGHFSAIPILVDSTDAVILDQQAHISVQSGAQLLRQKGTHIDMIRHSNLEMLERKIQEFDNKYDKIWYMIDGVYSMYGDVAPMEEIFGLLDKYPRLHVYIDDAHGMSWIGKNGCGYVFDKVGMHPKMVLFTTLAKGFGAIGGIAVLPNEEMKWKIQVWGGPLSYSHPLAPPMLGCAIASAKIHLSDEINILQKSLQEKVKYCNDLLEATGLPILSNPETPIKFVGAGQPNTGYNLIKKVMDDGFFVNTAIFPAVSVKNTGLRFTITNHQTKEDIKLLVDSIERNYHLALKEENTTLDKVLKAFRLPTRKEVQQEALQINDSTIYTSIKQIEQSEWDKIFKNKGTYNYTGLQFLEKAYSGNSEKENNWKFYYVVLKDEQGTVKLAAFITVGIFKDDFISPIEISKQIEERRKQDPYYLTSKVVALGSLISEGDHLYVDRTDENWKNYLDTFLQKLDKIKDFEGGEGILLRDFNEDDNELNKYFIEKGFFKIEMPNTSILELGGMENFDNLFENLSKRNRKQVRRDSIKPKENYSISIKKNISKEEIDLYYSLYYQVYDKNFALNMFPYPKKVFAEMASDKNNWEFMEIKNNNQEVVCVVCCYKTDKLYIPTMVGIDYTKDNAVYRVSILALIERAFELNKKSVVLGMSAETEKRKFGSGIHKLCAYLQVDDNYNMEVIASMGNN
jgi:7-keto-8-aminopelargonate synthetase-like enzyme/predicted N-acyltransferase